MTQAFNGRLSSMHLIHDRWHGRYEGDYFYWLSRAAEGQDAIICVRQRTFIRYRADAPVEVCGRIPFGDDRWYWVTVEYWNEFHQQLGLCQCFDWETAKQFQREFILNPNPLLSLVDLYPPLYLVERINWKEEGF